MRAGGNSDPMPLFTAECSRCTESTEYCTAVKQLWSRWMPAIGGSRIQGSCTGPSPSYRSHEARSRQESMNRPSTVLTIEKTMPLDRLCSTEMRCRWCCRVLPSQCLDDDSLGPTLSQPATKHPARQGWHARNRALPFMRSQGAPPLDEEGKSPEFDRVSCAGLVATERRNSLHRPVARATHRANSELNAGAAAAGPVLPRKSDLLDLSRGGGQELPDLCGACVLFSIIAELSRPRLRRFRENYLTLSMRQRLVPVNSPLRVVYSVVGCVIYT